jgi:hypothetical protein
VQGLGTVEVDCGRIDTGIEQNEERLVIHRGFAADLGLREVKRDAKCLPENRTARARIKSPGRPTLRESMFSAQDYR